MYDIAIIGGGINGCGIAADASQRNLSVLLCEQNDLGSGTSSASSKLIHGGLRYLEYYHFNLVRKALHEREILLRKAPHLVSPLNFVLPHHPNMRSRWLIRCGLWLYDFLAKQNSLASSRTIDLSQSALGSPLQSQYKHGFCYSDCWVDDARLVIANAMQARDHGATILSQHQCVEAKANQQHWQLQLRDQHQQIHHHQAKVLINAAGPWLPLVNQQITPSPAMQIQLVKGSHIVVPKRFCGTQAYILQSDDNRVIFILPYQHDFHLIGTTEMIVTNDPADQHISTAEIDYLCENVNRYLQQAITPDDIVHSFAGVRPLLDQQHETTGSISRDYALSLTNDVAPLLSVLGGKITTYRKLAQEAIAKLSPFFPHAHAAPASDTPLPGGDFSDRATLTQQLQQQYPWADKTLLARYVRSYGTLSYQLLENCDSVETLGQHIGHGLYAREVEYLCQQEWASSSDDILWRRTKLGLYMNAEETDALTSLISSLASSVDS